MGDAWVTVFGGTGFLGGEVVRALAAAGHRVRIAARRPAGRLFPGLEQGIGRRVLDIRDGSAVRAALEDTVAAVNAVSLYREAAGLRFEDVHVHAAGQLARLCREGGVRQLVHVSGIGVDPASPSAYVRARARGEQLVRQQFPEALVLRPSVMFGTHDSLLAAAERVTRLPVVPLFGKGETRLQPVFVGDVAAAAARALKASGPAGGVLELGGGAVYRYREILEAVMEATGRRRPMLPVPFAFWRLGARLMSVLRQPPLTLDQVLMLETDNVVSPGNRGFAALGIRPATLDARLSRCLRESGIA